MHRDLRTTGLGWLVLTAGLDSFNSNKNPCGPRLRNKFYCKSFSKWIKSSKSWGAGGIPYSSSPSLSLAPVHWWQFYKAHSLYLHWAGLRIGTTAVTERSNWQNVFPPLQFTLRLSHCSFKILTHVPSDVRLFQSSDQKIYTLDFFFNYMRFQVSWKLRGQNSKQSFGFITSKMFLKIKVFLNIKDGILSSFISHL